MINLLEYAFCLKLVLIFDIFITIYFYFTVEKTFYIFFIYITLILTRFVCCRMSIFLLEFAFTFIFLFILMLS